MGLLRTVRDCVYGMAVGDALGVPYEFRPRGSFTCTDMVGLGTHNQPAGTWSDDTSMALALCDSYRELGDINCDDILVKFRNWINEGAYTADGNVFDYGNATRQALDTGCGLAHALPAYGVYGMLRLRHKGGQRDHPRYRRLLPGLRGHDRLCPRGALQRARRLRE